MYMHISMYMFIYLFIHTYINTYTYVYKGDLAASGRLSRAQSPAAQEKPRSNQEVLRCLHQLNSEPPENMDACTPKPQATR